MPGLYTEADYENSVIELFRNDLGYDYAYGPDIERDFYCPLYEEVLIDSLYRLNRGLPDDAIQDALFKLKNFENGELVQKNAVFMDYLQNGIPVRYFVDGEERSSIVYLVDYKNPDNNSFIVANQWTFIENSNKRPDVILFLNGLPVVLVELKSPSREETDASEAYRQLRNYMQEIPSMFIYNAICVMSDQLTSKAGTITSGEDRFMEWKTKDGDYENTQYAQFDTFFEGMFQKERLLDIMKSVQGDSGHARMDMVADVYSHIIDEDRRYNAQKFEEQFYNAKGLKNVEEGKTAPMPKFETSVELLDPMAEVQETPVQEEENSADNSVEENASLIAKLLSNPETAALLKALAKTI